MNRNDIINRLIRNNSYKSYLEIGLGCGTNFSRVEVTEKVGVDPQRAAVRGQFLGTSDEYFKTSNKMFDIIFVDGLHRKDQVYRDIINSLEHLNDNGTILVHDCNPPTERHAQEEQPEYHPWNGSVWQAWLVLRMVRPDLNMRVLDCDWGIGIIRRGKQKLFSVPFELLAKYRRELLNLKSANERELSEGS